MSSGALPPVFLAALFGAAIGFQPVALSAQAVTADAVTDTAQSARALTPSQVEALSPPDLGITPYGEMEALLEVTIFNIDVLTLTVRVPERTASDLEAVIQDADRYDDALADSVARIILAADALWSRQEFERDVGYGRLLGAMRDSARKAAEAGYISQAYADEFASSLPGLFGFLEEDGVKEGDQILMLVRGNTVRTMYRTVDGDLLLDRSATSADGRNGSIPSFFAPKSDFRKRLVESLFAGGARSE